MPDVPEGHDMTNTDDAPASDTVRTAETAFTVLEYLKDADGATVSAVAADLGHAKSTASRHLSTLVEMGYVIREGDEFRVGLRFLDFGQHARTRRAGYELAEAKVEEIAARTGERAQFIVEEHGEAVYLHRSFGEHAVRTDPGIGSRIPLHATSAGKAVLAHLPEAERREVLDQADLEPVTEHTITDRDRLLEELDTIRERGYSFNRQENLKGLHAVGVAVSDPEGGIVGALSVSGPTNRLEGERFREELPSLLLGTANELELNVAHS